MEKLLTPAELAEMLQVPDSWVYERTRKRGPNSIPMIRVGKYCRFKFADVLKWLQPGKEENAA